MASKDFTTLKTCYVKDCTNKQRSSKIKTCEGHYRRYLRHGDYNLKKIEFHGYRSNPIYDCWHHMQERCSKPYCLNYKDYGARGISVCEEWNSPTIFIEWCLDNGWQSHLQIDRINNDGNYEPKNCRFVNQKQQMNNTRSNHWIEYDNKRKTLQQWGEFLNIKPNTILTRIRRGWPTGRALELE